MKIKLIIILIFLLYSGKIEAQTGHLCTPLNQWVNGNLEDSTKMSCYQWNPINNIATLTSINKPWLSTDKIAFRTQASTRWQTCSPVSEATIDHTLGTSNGHYIYVDPRNSVGNEWQVSQTINVRPGTNYVFSIWISSMTIFSGLPNVSLVVNGNPLVGPAVSTILPRILCPNPNNWIQLSGVWNSGSNTTAMASINVLNPQNLGYDFAIDDISFVGDILVNSGRDTTICMGETYLLPLGGSPP